MSAMAFLGTWIVGPSVRITTWRALVRMEERWASLDLAAVDAGLEFAALAAGGLDEDAVVEVLDVAGGLEAAVVRDLDGAVGLDVTALSAGGLEVAALGKDLDGAGLSAGCSDRNFPGKY